MDIVTKDFKPVVNGTSDKFSWNIYKLLTKYSTADIRVFKIGWNFAEGISTLEKGSLYFVIGDSPWPSTASIVRSTSVGPKAVVCCVSWSGVPWKRLDKEDVTEWFFREYSRIGRCLFQPEWAHDFTAINRNSRKCKHCGVIQRREVVTKKIIKRESIWH
jgi:hypothetical protein